MLGHPRGGGRGYATCLAKLAKIENSVALILISVTRVYLSEQKNLTGRLVSSSESLDTSNGEASKKLLNIFVDSGKWCGYGKI